MILAISMHEVLNLAHSLGEALAGTEIWQEVQDARGNVMRDGESYQLLARYQDANTKIERKSQDGLTITENEVANLEQIQGQLAENQLVIALQEAQDKFNQLMHSVYGIMDQALEGADGCGDGCDSCGGCGLGVN
jgi:cell fate (sporulation/competence/biofilm development) regulator YlbF (YheA/YmcA/DUF963 family)